MVHRHILAKESEICCNFQGDVDQTWWTNSMASTFSLPYTHDFFVWGAIKEMVYETPVDDIHVLLQRIMAAAEIIKTSSNIFSRMLRSLLKCYVVCRSENEGHFEHLLQHVN